MKRIEQRVDHSFTPLRVGWVLLAVAAAGLLAAPITILRNIADLSTRPGRHALRCVGPGALAAMEFLLAIIPIRRGERWAIVAAGLPFVLVGLPALVVDATNVAPERLSRTLAPQVVGLVRRERQPSFASIGTRHRAT